MATIASYHGILHRYDFIAQGKGEQLNVRISEFSGNIIRMLCCQEYSFSKTSKKFPSVGEKVRWLLDRGYTVGHQGGRIFFSLGLPGGMMNSPDNNADISEKEITYEKRLCKGNLGEIYTGKYQGKDVVIKELKQKLTGDPYVIEELYQEYPLMKKLNHPHIILFYGLVKGKRIAMVMEYAHNGSLLQMIKEGKLTQMPTKQRLEFALHILSALRFLHSKNVVHRDLKSSNVLIDQKMQAKVADFGLSKTKALSHTLRATIENPAWTAPELLLKQPSSFPADIYSFGMVLWELIELKIPFKDQNTMIVLTKLLQNEKKEEEISNKVDQKLAKIMRECWQIDPKKRPSLQGIEAELKPSQKEKLCCVSLNRAAYYGHKKCLDQHIQNGADVNKIEYNDSALHFAAWNGSLKCIELLIQNGANVDTINSQKQTPLHLAVQHGNTKCLWALLQNGADLKLKDEDNKIPFEYDRSFLDGGTVVPLPEVLETNHLCPSLNRAAYYGHKKCLDQHIQNGADVNKIEYNDSALHFAAWNGSLKCIELLIQNGAEVDMLNKNNYTPLHEAIQMNWLECVALLLKKGADPNKPDGSGETPLHWAVRYNHIKCLWLLLQSGGDPTLKNNEGKTAYQVGFQA